MQIQTIDSLTHEQAKEQLRLERAANLELRQQLESIGAGGVSNERLMPQLTELEIRSDIEAENARIAMLDTGLTELEQRADLEAEASRVALLDSDVAEDAARYRALLIEACNVILWAQRRLPAAYNIGLGGNSEGARQAGCNVVWAANHWPAAVQIHANNHPDTEHACQDLHQADWSKVPRHDLLMASPACQGHSRARGKERAVHDVYRSTAWAVVSAAEYHQPEVVMVENVPEYAKWALYPAWCQAMSALGYALTPMLLDAADFGVPQHRQRIFIVGTRSKHPIDLTLDKSAHVPATNIIDLDAGKWSPIEKPGRSTNTLSRIQAGRIAHGERFLVAYYGNEKGGRSLNRPIGTITTRDRWAVINGDRMRMLSVDENRRAMAFPDNYQLPERAKDAVHMLGNAVPPPMTREVINAIRRAA